MRLKKVIIPLVVTILCCMYYAVFAIICAATDISKAGKAAGLVIPGIIVFISVILFIRNYQAVKREAEEMDKEK